MTAMHAFKLVHSVAAPIRTTALRFTVAAAGPFMVGRRSLTILAATRQVSTALAASRPAALVQSPLSRSSSIPLATRSSSTSSSDSSSASNNANAQEDLDAAFTAGTPISGADLAALVRQGRTGVGKDVLVVDVRNPDEHAATGLIPTAVPLPLPELQAALQQPSMQFQLLNGFPKPSREGTNLVMYCKAGVRADMAAQVARGLGFKRVRSYKGSWIEWSDKYANVLPEGQGSSGSA